MNISKKTIITASLSILIAGALSSYNFTANADDVQPSVSDAVTVQETEAEKVVTEYSDLWTGTVVFKTGEPVQWYVHVPEDTEPKGCGATIKIPGLGWGTEAHNKDEGHITLKKGDNLVYEFTPEEAGDYIFTCWMGSGCHSNYIHVTDNGEYTAEKPSVPENIHTERNSGTLTVSFDAPETPEGAVITGYRIIISDSEGKRTKKITKETTALFENINDASDYTVTVYTLATSGKSEVSEEVIAEAISKPVTETTTSVTTGEEETVTTEAAEQTVITEYDDLWTGNITVKKGVPVKWYVNVPEGTEPKGCGATIKIPGLGWGTDTNNKNEDHFVLSAGKNLVYEFTPQEEGDILFTCWMGSGCHYNYIHVTSDGIPDSDAKTGGRGVDMSAVTTAAQTTTQTTTANTTTTTAATTTKAASSNSSSPKTGDNGTTGINVLLAASLGTAYAFRKRRFKA